MRKSAKLGLLISFVLIALVLFFQSGVIDAFFILLFTGVITNSSFEIHPAIILGLLGILLYSVLHPRNSLISIAFSNLIDHTKKQHKLKKKLPKKRYSSVV